MAYFLVFPLTSLVLHPRSSPSSPISAYLPRPPSPPSPRLHLRLPPSSSISVHLLRPPSPPASLILHLRLPPSSSISACLPSLRSALLGIRLRGQTAPADRRHCFGHPPGPSNVLACSGAEPPRRPHAAPPGALARRRRRRTARAAAHPQRLRCRPRRGRHEALEPVRDALSSVSSALGARSGPETAPPGRPRSHRPLPVAISIGRAGRSRVARTIRKGVASPISRTCPFSARGFTLSAPVGWGRGAVLMARPTGSLSASVHIPGKRPCFRRSEASIS